MRSIAHLSRWDLHNFTCGQKPGNAGPLSLGVKGGGAALIALLLAGGLAAAKAGPFGRAVHGWWGSHWHREGPFDPVEARQHAEYAASWVLRSVHATEDQQARVREIVGNLVDGIAPLAPAHQENRQAFLAELSNPTVDRAGLERIRQSELDLAASASTQLVNALADISEVLTPEQRGELLEAVERFHH